MYKITNNIELINKINQAAKLKEGNQEVNYCEIQKHPVRDEYAIPIIENILKGYNLSFIKEVLSNLVSELPEDWEWLYLERPVRLEIPLDVYAKSMLEKTQSKVSKSALLGEIIEGVMPVVSEYVQITKTHAIIYLEELFKNDETLIKSIEEIKIDKK